MEEEIVKQLRIANKFLGVIAIIGVKGSNLRSTEKQKFYDVIEDTIKYAEEKHRLGDEEKKDE